MTKSLRKNREGFCPRSGNAPRNFYFFVEAVLDVTTRWEDELVESTILQHRDGTER